ncbi:MAG: DUF3667 domain-containing protein [Cyclobacteriaceae bacterium]|nr:DUF3667 domain-containing protein [Cyclobacteriaceae bacterium]
MELHACRNCNAKVDGPYCSHCGQKVLKVPYTFKFIKDSIIGILDFDRGFLYTMKQLTVRPAYIIKEYLGGSTIRFTNPVKYLITVIGISLLLDLIYLKLVPHYTTDGESTDYLIALFLSISVWVWNFLLFKKEKNGTEHLVIAIYQTSQLFLMGVCSFMILQIIYSAPLLNEKKSMVSFLSLVPIIIYYIFFTKKVFRLTWIRSILLTILYFVTVIAMLGGVQFLTSLM